MRRFNFQDADFAAQFGAFADARRDTPESVDAAVRDVLEAVRARGLEALLDFTRRFDGVKLEADGLRVGAEEIAEGAEACAPPVREAIAFAARRIEAYHARQRPADARFTDEAGWSWAGAGRPWIRWGSTCPAAGRPTPRPC
jgi:histidinol dehydrogenase